MGREGILFLGMMSILWAWMAFKNVFPENAVLLTVLVGIPQAALAVTLFFKCKCGEKNDTNGA